MKKSVFLLIILITACQFQPETTVTELQNSKTSKNEIYDVLETWHAAAARANFDKYFDLMTGDAVFIGTDATENWQNTEFREFAKPHFEKGSAWSFSTLERNIYTSATGQTAWFDELLDTQMGICRGSGVLEKTGNEWKISHYVLSIAIPNEYVTEVTALKKGFDHRLISKLKKSE